MDKKQRKTLIIRIILFVGTAVSLYFVPWILVKAWILPLPDTIQGQLDQAIDHGFDGIVVYVDKKDEAPGFYAAGWHDPKLKIPARPDALYKIASIGKLYTAVGITKLVADGKLSLDDKLTDHFPDLKGRIQYAEDITIKMLVQHRSGIPNYTDKLNYWSNPKHTFRENLELILDLPANFEPNTDYEYCNTNYLLLRQIMDDVLGYPYYEYIQVEILNRLDLKNTHTTMDGIDMENVMSGYYVGHPYDIKNEDFGIHATAEDVGIFLRALNDGSLFDNNEQEIYSSIYRYEHTGLVPGYQSIAQYHKDIDAIVIQFTGPTDFEGYQWNLSHIVYNRIVKIISHSTQQ